MSRCAFADVIITNAATIANNVRFIIQFVLRVITAFIYTAKIVHSIKRNKGKTIKHSMVFPKVTGTFTFGFFISYSFARNLIVTLSRYLCTRKMM